jgi:hypothetical protein
MNRVLEPIIQRMFCLAILTFSLPLLVCGQQQDRVVDWQPVVIKSEEKILELVDTKVAGASITIGQTFTADEAWLNTLTFTIQNISGKTIKNFGFGIGFPELDPKGRLPGFSITYYGVESSRDGANARRSLLPGEQVDLKLPEDQLEIMRTMSVRVRGTPNLTKVKLLPALVNFEDGSGLGGVSLRKQPRE